MDTTERTPEVDLSAAAPLVKRDALLAAWRDVEAEMQTRAHGSDWDRGFYAGMGRTLVLLERAANAPDSAPPSVAPKAAGSPMTTPDPTRARAFHYPTIAGTAYGAQFPDGRVVVTHPVAGLVAGTTLANAIGEDTEHVIWDNEETAAHLSAYERLKAAVDTFLRHHDEHGWGDVTPDLGPKWLDPVRRAMAALPVEVLDA